MSTQTIFQAGNSSVVSLPKDLMKELGFKKGQKVIVGKSSEGEAIMIKKTKKKEIKAVNLKTDTALTPEFKNWLDNFMKEYKPVLDELAHL